jgi:hypothetical protein
MEFGVLPQVERVYTVPSGLTSQTFCEIGRQVQSRIERDQSAVEHVYRRIRMWSRDHSPWDSWIRLPPGPEPGPAEYPFAAPTPGRARVEDEHQNEDQAKVEK